MVATTDIKGFYNKYQLPILVLGAMGVLYLLGRKFLFTNFDDFIEIVFKNEGGFSDNKDDTGGATMYGISSVYNPEYTTKIKNRKLTKEDAKAIYKNKYYNPLQIKMLNNPRLRFQVFDFAVNAGISRAISTLKQVVKLDTKASIADTVKKANFLEEGGYNVWLNYKLARIKYYTSIATGTKYQFLKSWLNRTNSDLKL
jgi:hypothetical protein